MTINRSMKNGKAVGEVVLTDEEMKAVDTALNIVKARCASEGVLFNDDATYWTLLGMLREGASIDDLMTNARTTPIYKPKKAKRLVGYSY